jgi:hypothetical protein
LSKKPAALKVHQLAKELGVSSKDIVARCQAEEIPDIVNHLSPVSVGLALTVRQGHEGGEVRCSLVVGCGVVRCDVRGVG